MEQVLVVAEPGTQRSLRIGLFRKCEIYHFGGGEGDLNEVVRVTVHTQSTVTVYGIQTSEGGARLLDSVALTGVTSIAVPDLPENGADIYI